MRVTAEAKPIGGGLAGSHHPACRLWVCGAGRPIAGSIVAEIDGVKFYNDSKATSVDATSKALEALSGDDGRTILILGGRGKNAPYAPLIGLIEASVRALILVGEDADNIESQLSGHADILRADSIDDAVKKGFETAMAGDAVLLAPACASFDMFKSFEERGDVFKAAVMRLSESAASCSKI